MEMRERIIKTFQESSEVKKEFIEANADMVAEVAQLLANTFLEGGKLLILGNGGSSTDASHIAAEFVGRFKRERPGLPAIALNTDMAILTAVGNDYGFEEVFARQVKALATEGDVLIAISTSGNSPNVLKALEVAKKKKLKTVGLTGFKGGKMASRVNFAFVVPSEVTARIQETHITLGHVLCQMVDEILFENPRRRSQKAK